MFLYPCAIETDNVNFLLYLKVDLINCFYQCDSQLEDRLGSAQQYMDARRTQWGGAAAHFRWASWAWWDGSDHKWEFRCAIELQIFPLPCGDHHVFLWALFSVAMDLKAHCVL